MSVTDIKEIKKQEDIHENEKKLADKRSLLAPEAFEEERKKFRDSLAEAQRDIRKNTRD